MTKPRWEAIGRFCNTSHFVNKEGSRHHTNVHKATPLQWRYSARYDQAYDVRRIMLKIVNRIHYLIQNISPCTSESMSLKRRMPIAKSQEKGDLRISDRNGTKSLKPGSRQRILSTMCCSPDWGARSWLLTKKAAVTWRLPKRWINVDTSWVLVLCARLALH